MTTLIFPITLTEKNATDYDLPKEFLDEIYFLLKHFDEFCNKHNIQYWVDGGTMLGCMRERGQIPYDNDADVGVFEDAYNKIISLKSELESEPFNYVFKEEAFGCFKILSRNVAIQTSEEVIISPCLDIFMYKEFKDLIIIANEDFRRKFPQCYHMRLDFYPLIKAPYKELGLSCVNNPLPYLNRQYPNWWNTFIYDHKIYNVSEEQLKSVLNNSLEETES